MGGKESLHRVGFAGRYAERDPVTPGTSSESWARGRNFTGATRPEVDSTPAGFGVRIGARGRGRVLHRVKPDPDTATNRDVSARPSDSDISREAANPIRIGIGVRSISIPSQEIWRLHHRPFRSTGATRSSREIHWLNS